MSGEAYPANRQHDRIPITLEVNYNTEMDFLNGEIKNLGAGGIFIHTIYPLPEGTELNVRFAIPEIKVDFSVAARVVWSASSTDTNEETGMGLNFLNLGEKKAKVLKKFIESKLKKGES